MTQLNKQRSGLISMYLTNRQALVVAIRQANKRGVHVIYVRKKGFLIVGHDKIVMHSKHRKAGTIRRAIKSGGEYLGWYKMNGWGRENKLILSAAIEKAINSIKEK